MARYAQDIIFIIALPFIGYPQIPKPGPNTYIDDYTTHLSTEPLKDLNEQSRQLGTSTGVQMAAVLINDLPENLALEDYARNIGKSQVFGLHI